MPNKTFCILNGRLRWSFARSPTAKRPGMKHNPSNEMRQHTWGIATSLGSAKRRKGRTPQQRAGMERQDFVLRDTYQFGETSAQPGYVRHLLHLLPAWVDPGSYTSEAMDLDVKDPRLIMRPLAIQQSDVRLRFSCADRSFQ